MMVKYVSILNTVHAQFLQSADPVQWKQCQVLQL